MDEKTIQDIIDKSKNLGKDIPDDKESENGSSKYTPRKEPRSLHRERYTSE